MKKFLRPGSFLYHVTSFENWPSIQEHGLRPTCWLIDEFLPTAESRSSISRLRMTASVPLIADGRLVALIRDQMPLNRDLLLQCLDPDCSVEEWLGKLDQRVFFFTRKSDAEGLLKGKAYRGTRRVLLELERKSLVDDHWKKVEVADINTGVASRVPPKRGHKTFQKLSCYQREVDSRHIAELTVLCGVKDVSKYLRTITLYEPTGETKNLTRPE